MANIEDCRNFGMKLDDAEFKKKWGTPGGSRATTAWIDERWVEFRKQFEGSGV